MEDLHMWIEDFDAGHPEGAPDRDIRRVTITNGHYTWVRRFSANWNPHGFTIADTPDGLELSYLELSYVVGRIEHHVLL